MKMQENSDILEIEEEQDTEQHEVYIKYDIATYPSDFTLAGLYTMWQNGGIVIPDYQREFVWKINQSSLLIESFLIGLPVPPIFFYIDEANKSLVIDGQQRLLSIFYYFDGFFGRENERGKKQVFRLMGLDKQNPFYEKRFMDLDEADIRKLENSVLRAINVRQLSPSDNSTSVYYIFERLNTGGTPLKPQEIRNCIYRGEFLDTLRELNNNIEWRKIIGKKIPISNQSDTELILRAYGFCYYLKKYEKPMKEFLNQIAKMNQHTTREEMKDFIRRFEKATKVIASQLRAKPFSIRGPLNTSVLDSVLCTIINNVDNLPHDLSKRYESLIVDEKFIDYTSAATTDEKVVKERFKYVAKNMIEVKDGI